MAGKNRAGRRVLVTGAAGMLGRQLLLDVPDGVRAVGTDLATGAGPGGSGRLDAPGVDLTDPDAVEELWRAHGPFEGVLHAAAYTAVDRAEDEEELARRANAVAPEVLGRVCAREGVRMVLVSTDFVFDGSKRKPYLEDDPTAPLGAYGRTKLEGEERAAGAHPGGLSTVRTQWLYGPGGKHFPGTILRLASERDELSVVSDQVGSPTTTLELSPALWDVLQRGQAEIYHAACDGVCSWYDLAVATLRIAAGLEARASGESRLAAVQVRPCTTAEFPRPAPRPAYSVLDTGKLAKLRGRRLKPWNEALEDFLRGELEAEETLKGRTR